MLIFVVYDTLNNTAPIIPELRGLLAVLFSKRDMWQEKGLNRIPLKCQELSSQ